MKTMVAASHFFYDCIAPESPDLQSVGCKAVTLGQFKFFFMF